MFTPLVSMAKTPAEIKEDQAEACVPSSYPEPMYPWGLCISLDDDAMKKLGLEANCAVGDTVHIVCMAKVTSASQNETSEGVRSRVELQITDMAIESEDAEAEEVLKPQKKFGPKTLYRK